MYISVVLIRLRRFAIMAGCTVLPIVVSQSLLPRFLSHFGTVNTRGEGGGSLRVFTCWILRMDVCRFDILEHVDCCLLQTVAERVAFEEEEEKAVEKEKKRLESRKVRMAMQRLVMLHDHRFQVYPLST